MKKLLPYVPIFLANALFAGACMRCLHQAKKLHADSARLAAQADQQDRLAYFEKLCVSSGYSNMIAMVIVEKNDRHIASLVQSNRVLVIGEGSVRFTRSAEKLDPEL